MRGKLIKSVTEGKGNPVILQLLDLDSSLSNVTNRTWTTRDLVVTRE